MSAAELANPEMLRLDRYSQYSSGVNVYVVGEVRNPGAHVLIQHGRVEDALKQAGGVRMQGSVRKVEVRGMTGEIKHVDLLKFRLFGVVKHNPALSNGDVLYVPLRKGPVVQVIGDVPRPNTYELLREKTVYDVIALAGGEANMLTKTAKIARVRSVGEERVIEELAAEKSVLKREQVGDGDIVHVSFTGSSGGKSIDLTKLPFPGEDLSTALGEPFVYMLGGVQHPGPYPYIGLQSVDQYIAAAGGFTTLAQSKKIMILHMNNKKERVNRDSGVIPLPGDTIHVSEKSMTSASWMRLVIGIASVGLSTAATILTLTR